MTDLTLDQKRRIEKFKRRAKDIATSPHLEKILKSFPEEHRDAIEQEIQPLLNLKNKK